MEEFKNLEEIIELCKEELENNDENVHATLDLEDLKELRNLINKYEELEKERDGIYADYQDLGKEKLELEEENQIVKGANSYWVMKFCEITNKNKEQEKVIELMAKAFKQDDIRNEDEIIEYFRNEVKKNEKPEKN